MTRIWILSKRERLPKNLTNNWLYFVKMASIYFLCDFLNLHTLQSTLLLILLTTTSTFIASILDKGIQWIDNVQIIAQGITVVMTVSLDHKKKHTWNNLPGCRSLLPSYTMSNTLVTASHLQCYCSIGYLSILSMASNYAHTGLVMTRIHSLSFLVFMLPYPSSSLYWKTYRNQ